MNFVDHALARRLEMMTARSCQECTEAVKHIPSAALAIAGGIAAFTGIDSPITQAFGVGMDGPVTEAAFDELENFFFSRGAPVTLEICPFIDPSVASLLKQRLYRFEEVTNVLAREIKPGATFEHGPSVVVRDAKPDEAGHFTSIVAKGFEEQFPLTESLRLVLESFFHHARGRCLFALVDGELAGGACVGAEDGLAELYGAATVPLMRGRGVQTSLIAARLAWAAKQGCTLATTSTQPGSISQRNFERAGFRVVYSRTKLVRKLSDT